MGQGQSKISDSNQSQSQIEQLHKDQKLIQSQIMVLMLASSSTGVKQDIEKFKSKLKHLYPKIQSTIDMLLPRNSIINRLQLFLSSPAYQIHFFYAGHGHKNGNWQVLTSEKPQGDQISLQQILNLWNKTKKFKKERFLYLYLDSCYSGNWCSRLAESQEKNVSVIASCSYNEKSKSSKAYGGFLYNCILGQEKDFEDNFQLLAKFGQNPVCSMKGGQVTPLKKDHLKLLQQNIKNAGNLFPSYPPIEDKKSIKVINYNLEDCRLQYEGEVKNGKIQGRGYLFLKNGAIYKGQFKNEKFEGRGTYYYNNYFIYNGQWKNGQKHGKGTFYFNNGDKYVGQFLNDKAHGKGILYYFNRDIYKGEFKQNYLDGSGVFYYYNGDRYEGEFKKDKREGKGIYYYQQTGARWIGKFKNNLPYGNLWKRLISNQSINQQKKVLKANVQNFLIILLRNLVSFGLFLFKSPNITNNNTHIYNHICNRDQTPKPGHLNSIISPILYPNCPHFLIISIHIAYNQQTINKMGSPTLMKQHMDHFSLLATQLVLHLQNAPIKLRIIGSNIIYNIKNTVQARHRGTHKKANNRPSTTHFNILLFYSKQLVQLVIILQILLPQHEDDISEFSQFLGSYITTWLLFRIFVLIAPY